MRRKRGWAAALAVTAVIAGSSVVAPAVSESAAAFGDGSIAMRSSFVYVVDPAAGAVHVTVDASVTNTTSQYVITGVPVVVQKEATNFSRSVTRDAANEFIDVVLVNTSPEILPGQTQSMHLTYDLPSQPARSTGLTHVSPAFTTFLAFGTGDPGQVDVEVVVPTSYKSEIVGEQMQRRRDAAGNHYSATAIPDPDTWVSAVSGRNDAALASKRFTVEGNKIAVSGWPEDPEWSNFVHDRLRKGVPVMRKLIGQPWPYKQRLQIIETITPYLYGYAGWYGPSNRTIEVGDELNADVVLHELSHLWFNDSLFKDRWISEGFAQEYASRALEQIGEPATNPAPVDRNALGAITLNDWSAPRFQDETTQASEQYGYNAAWFVVHAIAKEIGVERLRTVIDAQSSGQMSYRAHGEVDLSNPDVDNWQDFLDLLEEVGDSQQASELFASYVATPAQQKQIADRTRTRARYAELVADGGKWLPPLFVRNEMEDWDFAQARKLMPRVGVALEVRDEIERTLKPIRVPVPASLRVEYELSPTANDLEATMNRVLRAAKALALAEGEVGARHSIVERVGLLGNDPDSRFEAAKRAFADGDYNEAQSHAETAADQVDGASGAGWFRIEISAGVIVLLVVLIVAVWPRRTRQPSEVAPEEHHVEVEGV